MATLGNLSIADKNSVFDSGAAFLLQQKSSVNEVIKLPDTNWEVEVPKHIPYVVTRSIGLTEQDVTWEAHEAAQKGLDLLSANDIVDLSIRDAEIQRIVWWRNQNSEQILRIVASLDYESLNHLFGVRISLGTPKDSFGNDISSRLPTRYNLGMRYARLARLSSDLFDAYRNMYLALEFMVSEISCIQESELDWLQRVLCEQVPRDLGYIPARKADIEEIYKVRCAVFHAKKPYEQNDVEGARKSKRHAKKSKKDPKEILTPHKASDRDKVRKTLRKLENIVTLLSAYRHNTERNQGRYTEATHILFFHHMADEFFQNLDVFICSEAEILSKDLTGNEEFFFGEMPFCSVSRAPQLCDGFGLVSCLGRFSSTEIASIEKIAGLIWRMNNSKKTLMEITDLHSELIPSDVDSLEVQVCWSYTK